MFFDGIFLTRNFSHHFLTYEGFGPLFLLSFFDAADVFAGFHEYKNQPKNKYLSWLMLFCDAFYVDLERRWPVNTVAHPS